MTLYIDEWWRVYDVLPHGIDHRIVDTVWPSYSSRFKCGVHKTCKVIKVGYIQPGETKSVKYTENGMVLEGSVHVTTEYARRLFALVEKTEPRGILLEQFNKGKEIRFDAIK